MRFPGRPIGEQRQAWLRGPAQIVRTDDGEFIEVDRSKAKEWHFQTKADRVTKGDPLVELAHAYREADFERFATEFGLLHKWPDDPTRPWRNSLVEFEQQATLLANLARLYEQIGVVIRRSTPEGLNRLRSDWGERIQPMFPDRPAQSDEEFLTLASEGLADLVSAGLKGVQERVSLRARAADLWPRGWLFDSEAPDLLTHCYHQFAMLMTGQVPIAQCADPTCGRFFGLTDPRMRYCSPEHGNRVRVQRSRAKKEKP
jgi:hypothetical protein